MFRYGYTTVSREDGQVRRMTITTVEAKGNPQITYSTAIQKGSVNPLGFYRANLNLFSVQFKSPTTAAPERRP